MAERPIDWRVTKDSNGFGLLTKGEPPQAVVGLLQAQTAQEAIALAVDADRFLYTGNNCGNAVDFVTRRWGEPAGREVAATLERRKKENESPEKYWEKQEGRGGPGVAHFMR